MNLEKGEKLLHAMELDYQALQEKDRLMDKNFKKEFTGLGFHQMDALYKLFKKRPKVTKILYTYIMYVMVSHHRLQSYNIKNPITNMLSILG